MHREMSPDLKRQISPETQETAKLVGRSIESSEDVENHPNNEDSSFLTPDLFMGVCDGMGSGPAGEKASKKAKEMFLEAGGKMRPEAGVADWRNTIENTLREANDEVIKIGQMEIFKISKFLEEKGPGALVLYQSAKDVYKAIQEENWDLSPAAQKEFTKKSPADIEKIRLAIAALGMKIETPAATTATVAKVLERPDGDSDLVYGHVGDSRLYVLRLDGTFEQITEDQGALQYFVEQGDLSKEEAEAIDQCTNLDDLDKLVANPKYAKLEDAEKKAKIDFFKRLFANRHGVTSGLGFPEAKFQTGVVRLKPGERAVLVGDGNSDVQTKEQLAKNAASGTPAEAAAMINAESVRINKESEAKEKKGQPRTLRAKRDDKTAIVIQIPEKIEEISADEITEEPEDIVELGEEDVEAVPLEVLESEDRRKSSEEIRKIKRAIGA